MKQLLILMLVMLTDLTVAQSNFPDFLQGTWKVENKEEYEHWDKLNDNVLKGFSYAVDKGQWVVFEYLEINRKGNEIILSANAIGQNQGRDIDFKLTKSDSVFTFENPDHDFPNEISYQILTGTEIFVQISGGGNQKSLEYKLKKQHVKAAEKDTTAANPDYNVTLAEKLGADDYGMKSYILVVLKTGTNQTADQAVISEKFRGHLDNITRLVEQKKLIVAGPLGKNDNNYRGIFILNNVATFEEATELLQTDPAIKAGLLDAELYNWYGSAALPEYLQFTEKIWKVKP